MKRGLFEDLKCTQLKGRHRASERICIAVTEEDILESLEIAKTETTEVTKAVKIEEAREVRKEVKAVRVSRKKKSGMQMAFAALADNMQNVWEGCKNGAGKLKSYVVFDTVVGKEKNKDSFKAKCTNAYESAKHYITNEKNRQRVALGSCGVLAALALVVVMLNFSVGYEAVVNGQVVGIVSGHEQCEKIINDINATLAESFGEESKINAEITTIPRLVSRDGFTAESEIKNEICKLSDKMHEMYVIYLEDTALCALASEAEAQQTLDDFRDYYTGDNENVTFETDKQLVIKAEQAPVTLLKSVADAVDVLNGSERKENDYTVMAGDTLWSISRKFDTSVDEILAINEGLDENIVDGDVITVKSYVPVVNVTTSQIKEYTEKIKYETEVVESSSMYRGRSTIEQEGVNGERAVVANVIKHNGQEIQRDIISQTTLKEPVTQIKKVGTKEPPSGYGTGKFIAPVYGTITSRYGYRRSGFHKGLDIANSTGTPIRAADNGRVITAGWDGLFGKLVKLDHQNGYVTYYAHNSRIAVKVGQTVEKGEIIAYMGSTGNSTGPHCHFEIHKNGVLQNPSNYI